MRNFKGARQSTGSDAFLSSDRADRVRDLLSPLNLPALPTGGSKVRLILIGNPASVTEMIIACTAPASKSRCGVLHSRFLTPMKWCGFTAKIDRFRARCDRGMLRSSSFSTSLQFRFHRYQDRSDRAHFCLTFNF